MNTIVAAQNPAVKTDIVLTIDNAHAIGVAYQFGVSDGRKGSNADEVFFDGETLTAYRLGYEVGVAEAQIEADEEAEDEEPDPYDYDEEDTRPLSHIAISRAARNRHDEYGIWY